MKRITALLAVLILLPLHSARAETNQSPGEAMQVRIMSFNILADGRKGTIDAIKIARPDIVGLQEVEKATAERYAQELGWEVAETIRGKSIITRYKIIKRYKMGVRIELSPGVEALVFNIHFRAKPYQPYQLLDIPYGDAPFIKTEAQAIEWAKKARGDQVEALLKEIGEVAGKDSPVFVTGDFNEPSHLDWTRAAADKGMHPIKVAYPTSTAMIDAGFIDAYRKVHPSEIKKPGYTWTPNTKPNNPKDHHDRIDFVYYRGKSVKPKSAQIVGEHKDTSDIVMDPYPSDHRAVVVTFEVWAGAGAGNTE